MQFPTLVLLCTGLISSSLAAQAAPGWIDQDPATPGIQAFKQSDYFTASIAGAGPSLGKITTPAPLFLTSGVGTIHQCSMGKSGLAGLAPGEYHMCITLTNLSTAYGGVGSQDVVMGMVTWNSGSPVFTPNMMANNLNLAGNVFGMMIDTKDGKFAVVDHPTGPVISYRANNTLPFDLPLPITGAAGPYVDPALGYVNGTLNLFWIVGMDVHRAPLTTNISGGKLTAASVGPGTAVIQIGNQAHSCTPVTDSNGEVMGFWFASLVASDSDMHFQSMADVSSAHVLCWDTPGWLNNGGVAGGHFLAADSGIGYAALQYGQGYYLVSNTEVAVGPTATLNLRVGGQSGNPSINPSILALAFGVVPPVAIPGLLGEFALKASPMVVFGGPTSATADDVADLVVPATDVSLKGLTLHLQGLVNPTDQSLGASFTSTVSPKFN